MSGGNKVSLLSDTLNWSKRTNKPIPRGNAVSWLFDKSYNGAIFAKHLLVMIVRKMAANG